MANEGQLVILKYGAEVWNNWRVMNSLIEVDLSGAKLTDVELRGMDLSDANLSEADLCGANLNDTDLIRTNLYKARLTHSHLMGANLIEANLIGADLSKADLSAADLSHGILIRANISGAKLVGANLRQSNLTDTNLYGANLGECYLGGTNLSGANLTSCSLVNATTNETIFADLDLSHVNGLSKVSHKGPSTVGVNTLFLSKGKIPEIFLRGCGLSDWEIETVKLYNPNLSNDEITNIQYKMYDLRATQALQISPLFVSYSHADNKFIDKIGNGFTEKGVRYWRDIHDMKAGRMEKQIDRAIRQNPTVLLVLSKHSLSSDWVEHEVRTARGLEKDMGRDVLCPIALDDSWKSSHWPARLMEQIKEYNILDFSEWEDDVKFEGMFRKLIDGLELFYKG